MDVEAFEFEEFFRAVEHSGARALLIGRRALILLGLPVMTTDYDFWIHIDDIASFNAALAPFDLVPNRSPDEARARGRYALEDGVHVDVLVARSCPTVTGARVSFDDLWDRRQRVPLGSVPPVSVAMPSIPDLIATKEFALRPKDAQDIRLLRLLLGEGEPS